MKSIVKISDAVHNVSYENLQPGIYLDLINGFLQGF